MQTTITIIITIVAMPFILAGIGYVKSFSKIDPVDDSDANWMKIK